MVVSCVWRLVALLCPAETCRIGLTAGTVQPPTPFVTGSASIFGSWRNADIRTHLLRPMHETAVFVPAVDEAIFEGEKVGRLYVKLPPARRQNYAVKAYLSRVRACSARFNGNRHAVIDDRLKHNMLVRRAPPDGARKFAQRLRGIIIAPFGEIFKVRSQHRPNLIEIACVPCLEQGNDNILVCHSSTSLK
jgi:hypothetical protein